ncbi:MAG: glutamate synthase [Candidatus Coproplasma sp.]
MVINVNENTHFKSLNQRIRETSERDITVNGCIGQRYIATGMSGKSLKINGTPGNALGAYLNGGDVVVYGNGQDATGDTMNSGSIIIHGNAGDATGYAMRGGKIYIKGNTGYRAGIHMKEYLDSRPVLVVGGRAGSFLGEYQAGGTIVVLGKHDDGLPIVNHFTAMGMHGGKIYLRCEKIPYKLPDQVQSCKMKGSDIPELKEILQDYCSYFDCFDADELLSDNFYVLTPNTSNPYKQMYTNN